MNKNFTLSLTLYDSSADYCRKSLKTLHQIIVRFLTHSNSHINKQYGATFIYVLPIHYFKPTSVVIVLQHTTSALLIHIYIYINIHTDKHAMYVTHKIYYSPCTILYNHSFRIFIYLSVSHLGNLQTSW